MVEYTTRASTFRRRFREYLMPFYHRIWPANARTGTSCSAPSSSRRAPRSSPARRSPPAPHRAPAALSRPFQLAVDLHDVRDADKPRLQKDTRDTARRRVRQRDGALLRGGLGLTIRSGWSGSEDGDAPSSVTRRLGRSAAVRRSCSGANATFASTSALPKPAGVRSMESVPEIRPGNK
jgi:hypothetical protein